MNRDRQEVTPGQQLTDVKRSTRVRVPELAIGLLIVSACVLADIPGGVWHMSQTFPKYRIRNLENLLNRNFT